MHKLQCLNISKSYLEKTFLSSLQFLADNSYWRNTFNDQLHIIYKEWMYKKIGENISMDEKSGNFQDDVVEEQF